MICEQCKLEQAHITKIGGVLRWLCWDCTKALVLENRARESNTTYFEKAKI